MKKIFILLQLLFCLSSFSIGQVIAVCNDKQNIFYIGLDNPVTIAVENTSFESITIKAKNGSLTGQNGRYIFRSERVGPAEITIYKNDNNKLEEIGKSNFRVKHLPLPTFKIGSGKNRMPKVEIAHQEYVRAELENFDIDIKYTIDSFKVCIISSDTCKYGIKTNYGNKISEEIRNEFKMLKPNDIVVFKDIFIKQPDGTGNMIAPVIVTLY